MDKLNNIYYVFWMCIVLHLVSDYYLQGILGSMKQIDWWNVPDNPTPSKYWKDWIAALICHSAEWSILTFLPLMFTLNGLTWSFFIIVNLIIHAIVDDLKANRQKLNLNQDQAVHLLQIIISLAVWYWIK